MILTATDQNASPVNTTKPSTSEDCVIFVVLGLYVLSSEARNPMRSIIPTPTLPSRFEVESWRGGAKKREFLSDRIRLEKPCLSDDDLQVERESTVRVLL